ncbi:MAG: hypothetical protein HY515_03550 [Candidatus Aenigmarchaeota archaeon]|nr:hypothetical protein [Candidatus Aenigmarchaeota archaeon]
MPERTEEQLRELYPVSATYTPLDGFDIHRTKRRITALVVVEDQKGGRDLRLYSWQLRKSNGNDADGQNSDVYRWKVDLARQSVMHWNVRDVATQARKLARKYDIKMDSL